MADATATRNDQYTADDLMKLEGLDGIRKRPDMYIGGRDVNGLHHLVYEIVANSVDEALAGRCNNISVEFNQDGSCTVTDDGHGIPVGINKQTGKPGVEMVLSDLHAGGKFEGKAYNTAGGLHGIGLKAVNACSEWTRVVVWQGGKEHQIDFARGNKTKDLRVNGPADRTGTRISFLPDPTIFDTIEFKYAMVAARLRELAFLAKGLKINLRDHRGEGKEEIFHFKDGIKEFVAWHNRNKTKINEEVVYVHKTVNEGKDDEVDVEAAFQWCEGEGELPTHTYGNYINNPFGGTSPSKVGTVNLVTATGVAAGMPLNVPQSGGSTIQGNDYRPQDFEYRNGYAWSVSTIACNPGGGTVNCIRWAKINPATATVVDAWTPAICVAISSVARAVWLASDFTSLATTAKPLPSSPARAASMVALSASRLV